MVEVALPFCAEPNPIACVNLHLPCFKQSDWLLKNSTNQNA